MTCDAARLRCPVCGNPDWHARSDGEECTHCGLHVADPAALATAALAILQRLADGSAEGRPGERWSLTPAAWRNAAWRHGYTLADRIARPSVAVAHEVTLAIMTSPREADMAAALVSSLDGFGRAIVIVDADDPGPWRDRFAGAELIAHCLAGDFAAQRNRLQAAAGEGWVLQIDSDECPDALLLASLGWFVAAAERDGLRSLGLARRNLVDGAQAALYPDIQYRLNHADVRFSGVVHERPVVPFDQTALALRGAIEHRLDAARVRARSLIYAGMSAGGGRPEDEARLLRRFDPIADR